MLKFYYAPKSCALASHIALEEAGIVKPGVPALTIPQMPGVMKVLRDHAEKVGAPFMVVGEEIEFSSRFVASPAQGPHMRVCLSTPRNNGSPVGWPEISTPRWVRVTQVESI